LRPWFRNIGLIVSDGIKRLGAFFDRSIENYSEEVNRTLADPKLKSDILRYSVKPIGFPEIVPVLTEEYEQPE
jgi:hypothetical protein